MDVIPIAALAAASMLVLTGCASAEADDGLEAPADVPAGAAEDDLDAEPADDASRGSATFTVGGREFTVQLRMCAVYDDEDVLLSGPATEAGSGQVGYLDGDATMLGAEPYGEFRIDIGADAPMQSTDDFLSMGNSSGDTFTFESDGDGYVITASAWNANGDDLGLGTLAFTCS